MWKARTQRTIKRVRLAGAVLAVLATNDCRATQSQTDLLNLSLEDLINIKVSTGNLSQVFNARSPSAVTVITKQHIERSAAKNLTDILEDYVPGLIVMTHSEGDKIGLRGHIAAENYNLLLLVNGKNITNMVYEGPITELDQWNLDDIEKIEVVRGPGSVVYGTGAIAGVINIITKAPEKDKSSLNVNYNPEYRSKGFSYQFSPTLGQFDTYLFGSYQTTDGLESPNYYIPNPTEPTDIRYVGKGSIDEYGPQPYLADAFDRPQIKLHADIRYKESFKLFTRYTQSGQLHHFRSYSPVIDDTDTVIGQVPNRKVSLRSFIFAPEYTFQLNDTAKWETSLTYDTQEYLRYDHANYGSPEQSPDNVRDYAFSQNRLVASALYSIEKDNWNLTTGYEYTHINVAAPWGENADHIMVREGNYLISDFDTSVYTQDQTLRNRPSEDRAEEIGNGIDFVTHTHLIEANYSLTPTLTLQYGHRLDFPDASSKMFSPRFSIISQYMQGHTATLTAQRALRMMPLRAQYLYNKYAGDSEADYEKIDSLEFSYTFSPTEKSSLSSRAFYNRIDAVGYTGRDLQLLANYSITGLELEATYRSLGFELTANHSYIKNTDFKMSEALKDGTNRNNISYSDYYYVVNKGIPIELNSYGNGLNNLPQNTTKIIAAKMFMDDALSLQLNAQIFWDFDGAYDEMRMYQQAYSNKDTSSLSTDDLETFEQQYTQFEHERLLLEKQDAYKTQINIGASLAYTKHLGRSRYVKTTLYVQNLLHDRKRYYVNTGSSNVYTNRLNFMEEPTAVWLNVKFSH